nr:MAG TPA: hypothetical protein [Caudoviricetes sp.]
MGLFFRLLPMVQTMLLLQAISDCGRQTQSG